MGNLGYYFSIFRRRSPYFLLVATVISAISITVAYTLPPAYESRMVLLVEAPQIPEELAASTVQTPAFEQLQVVRHRLLTRENMLDIARKFDVLPEMDEMSPDDIVEAMRARTKITISNQRRQEAPLMTVTFEAPAARTTAEVLNEYLQLIQLQDTEFRKGRSGETLAFFIQNVSRLSEELDQQGSRILAFKQANSDSLPDSLPFRLDQQATFQDRLTQIDRDTADLRNQKERLVQLFELTGNVTAAPEGSPPSPEEHQLAVLRQELNDALAVYSPENPRIALLNTRIAQLEEKVGASPTRAAVEPETDNGMVMPPVLVIQLSEIDDRILNLQAQKASVQGKLDEILETIAKTPEVSITLEDLERKYSSLQGQYEDASTRLAKAQTGDLIETRSRGQRLAVIEQPAVPSSPTKPNRIMIAGGGTIFGILAGIALIILMEMLNSSARRPEDIVSKLGVTPLTTIPYIQTRGEQFRRQGLKLLLLLTILTGTPAAVYAVHTLYLPLDLLAERVMNKAGIRW